jgi:threonine aldolase
MDGARFVNAVASLGCSPAEVTWKAGVDVLCFGGTKNGMAVGEAVVFFDKSLSSEFAYRCKQAGQLASKMRFLAAPWVGMLQKADGAPAPWLKYASNANATAKKLEKALLAVQGVKLMFPVQANAVFAEIPLPILTGLRAKGWALYTFIGVGGARFMCSWDNTDEDVARLVADIESVSRGK